MNAEKVIDEVTDYLQELMDYGFTTETKFWLYNNPTDGESIASIDFILSPNREIKYIEIKEILEESVDRINEFYRAEIAIETKEGKFHFSGIPKRIEIPIKKLHISVKRKPVNKRLRGFSNFKFRGW